MRNYVIGDIHGRYKALKQVLKISRFIYSKDRLIVLGDIVDGGYNTSKVVEELLKIKNLIFVLGNHDEWFMNHISNGWADQIWITQGGANTLRSYGAEVEVVESVSEESKIDTRGLNIPVTHQNFFNKAVYYYVLNDMLFVHGGINPAIPGLSSQSKHDLLWDRNLINFAQKKSVPGFLKVFVGHTTTQCFGSRTDVADCMTPLKFNNLIMMDTGAGLDGRLSMMDINTEQVWRSDIQKSCIIEAEK